MLFGRLTDVREDDAWNVGLTLANSGLVRELHGSVWEAILDENNNGQKDEKDVFTGTDLQNYEGLLTHIQKNGLKGISVELVELCDDGKQVVRAKTTTNENGEYKFTSYIAGNYVVRFIYGEKDKDIRGKTTNSVGETLQVNGQYYQSTKANDKTDETKYWYDTEKDTRYSDAYDDALSRVNQINASIEGTNSTSSDYEYDGVLKVQKYEHKDTIYAYTSTLNLEIEYVKHETDGNKDNTFYEYKVVNVDFGLTPRANADLNIDKYVENIKIYLQDGTLQLDANITEDGTVTYVNDPMYTNIVLPNKVSSNAYLDGLIETLIDEGLLNGATLEITYRLTTSNDGEYDTIRYFKKDDGSVISVAYYGEELVKLVTYEGDLEVDGNNNTYTPNIVNEEGEIVAKGALLVKGQTGNVVYHAGVRENYTLETCVNPDAEREEIRTSATNIVDYIDPSLNFSQVNKKGETINTDWELTNVNEFNSSREKQTEIMSKYSNIIRAKDDNKLYARLLPGEKTTTTLTLSKVLATTSTETNDYEYSNLIEITKIHNDAGKVIDIEGYDITGKINPETSKNRKIVEIIDPIIPTLRTSKSETIVIHSPTGLSIQEEAESNLGIVLVVLVVLAVGIVLIKKFVLVPKSE